MFNPVSIIFLIVQVDLFQYLLVAAAFLGVMLILRKLVLE